MTNQQKTEPTVYSIWKDRWNNAQEKEDLTFLGKRMFKAKKKALLNILKEIQIKTVIEVGCGLGHTMEVFKDNKLDCLGIDISPQAVALCQKKGLNAVEKKLEELEETYDLVSSDGMLEHFLNFEPYAKYMMKASNKYVLLIQPNYDSFSGKTLSYLANILRSHINVYEYNYRIADFISVFEHNNFETVGNWPVFFNVFRILLFKRVLEK